MNKFVRNESYWPAPLTTAMAKNICIVALEAELGQDNGSLLCMNVRHPKLHLFPDFNSLFHFKCPTGMILEPILVYRGIGK